MTYHVPKVRELIFEIKNRFSASVPRIMVGGMPFNNSPDLWRTVGADLWAADAEKAVEAAQRITSI
jgi:methanogenic corrinoid protein MtbC1